MSEAFEIYAGGGRDGLVVVEVRVGDDVVARIHEKERGKPIEGVLQPERLGREDLQRALAGARESYADWDHHEARLLLELAE